MNSTISHSATDEKTIDFWSHLVALEELRDRTPLEKLLAGCEVIAALDGVDLLAA